MESTIYPNTLDRKGIHKYIYTNLGGGVVDVHLTKCQYDEAVDEAIRWWRAKKGLRKWYDLQLMPMQTEYPLPEDVDEVTEVIPSEHGGAALGRAIDPFYSPGDGIPWGPLNGHDGMGLMSAFVQTLQFQDQLEKITSTDFSWERAAGSPNLTVFTPSISGQKCRVFYLSKTVVIEKLSERDNDLIKRYAFAQALYIISNIWGKYSDGFLSAQGSRSLNYAKMAEDSASLKEKLEEELVESSKPAPILWGK